MGRWAASDRGDAEIGARTAFVGYGLLCLLLGGASAGGYVANALLQLLAVLLLARRAIAGGLWPPTRPERALVALVALMLLLVVVQLVPLPPSLWTALPGRGIAVEGYRALGLAPPWLPLALRPVRALTSAMWMLPALAIGFAAIAATREAVRGWAWMLAAVATATVVLGVAQLAGGSESPAYLYSVTNAGEAVGFFSNANHAATLLVATVPFLAGLASRAGSARADRPRAFGLRVTIAALGALTVLGVVLVGSGAGILLLGPVLVASYFVVSNGRLYMRSFAFVVGALAAVAVGVVLVAISPLGRDLAEAVLATGAQSRGDIFPRTLAAAREMLPWGGGLGSFTALYALHENPAEVTGTFVNHAHSDYLELLLETGVPGMILLAAFLIWWVRRVRSIWLRAGERLPMARAASVASGAILLHSLVDYPLRSVAIMSLFAVCCAIMANPEGVVRRKLITGARHLSA